MIKTILSSPNIKKYINWAGLGLGILGIAFIVKRFTSLSTEIDFSNIKQFQWAMVFMACFIYCGACVIQGLGWHNILKHLDVAVESRWSISTFGISQLAKYVPGNIFQFASRQAIGVSEGYPGVPLAKSIGWELGLMGGTAFLFSIFIIPIFNINISIQWALLLFFLAFTLLVFLIGAVVGKRISYTIVMYAILFALTGFVFVFILTFVVSKHMITEIPYISLFGIYIFAWLIGFITPGAPAGVGIREAVLFTFLNPFIPSGDLLLTIVIMRFITVGGDLIYYGISWILRKEN